MLDRLVFEDYSIQELMSAAKAVHKVLLDYIVNRQSLNSNSFPVVNVSTDT